MEELASMSKRLVLVMVGLSLLLPLKGNAAFEKEGALGVGARSLGMGNAFGAIANDLSAVYYNPAGLVQIGRPEITGMGGVRFNGKFYDTFVSAGMPAVSDLFFAISYDTAFNTLSNNSEDTYILSLATPINDDHSLSFGLNVKYDYTNLKVQNGVGQGFGFDYGLMYQLNLSPFMNKMNFAASVQDVATKIQWGSNDETTVPQVSKLGFAYWFDPNMVFDGDLDISNDPNIASSDDKYYHIGVEAWFFDNHVGLRSGYTTFLTMRGQYAAGISGKGGNWEIDYAYLGHDQNLGDSHRVSGTLRFGSVTDASMVPKPPTGVFAKGGDGVINVFWSSNLETNLAGYNIYLSQSPKTGYYKVGTVRSTSYTIKGLQPSIKYYVVVTAFTNATQPVESNYSEEVEATTAGPAVTPGGEPTGSSPMSSGEIPIPVKKVTDPNVVGVNIYYSATSGVGYVKYNQVPVSEGVVVIKGLVEGQTYFLVQKYYYKSGKEGPPSKEKAVQAQAATQ